MFFLVKWTGPKEAVEKCENEKCMIELMLA